METRQITVSFERQLVDDAERILDDIGLGFQSGMSVFLKRVVKDGGIGFLLQNAPQVTAVRPQAQKNDGFLYEGMQPADRCDSSLEESFASRSWSDASLEESFIPPRRSNSEITEEMRDYIWTIFTKNKNLGYSDYQELAREVFKKTGMNQGSAYIYFIMLSCFVEGKFNTRTMKFADLSYYVKRILQEYPKAEFAATIRSLERSIPYWAEKIPGRFSQKAQSLVNQYKPLLADMPTQSSIEKEKPVEYSRAGFEKYLISAGYKQYTPSGQPSTVYDYAKRIDKVCDTEGITWAELPMQITHLIVEYDVGGSKESIGAESHNSVINALKRLYEYIYRKQA